MNLSGKAALVTGAARRVGLEIAKHLAAKGAAVAVHYNTSHEEALQAVAAIEALGVRSAAVQGDMAKVEDIRRFVDEAHALLGRLDILVNSASVFPRTPFRQVSPEEWDAMMDINARGPFFCAQAAAEHMQDKGGVIINIADVRMERPRKDYVPYIASKSALASLTSGLARVLAPAIRVNAIGPGSVMFPESYTEEQKRKAVEGTLLKRAGTPEDIARAVVFLCESDYITGAFLPVDGGLNLA